MGLVILLELGLLFGVGSLLCILVTGLFASVAKKQLPTNSKRSLNEGIRRSVKNGLFLGLLSGLLGGLISGLVADRLAIGWFSAIAVGLFFGGLCTTVAELFFGLGAAIRHYILRFSLWQTGCTPAPWRYVAFLDDTVEQLLLRKVGGGYFFRHRLLQDYFALLETNRPPDGKTDQAPQISLSPE